MLLVLPCVCHVQLGQPAVDQIRNGGVEYRAESKPGFGIININLCSLGQGVDTCWAMWTVSSTFFPVSRLQEVKEQVSDTLWVETVTGTQRSSL